MLALKILCSCCSGGKLCFVILMNAFPTFVWTFCEKGRLFHVMFRGQFFSVGFFFLVVFQLVLIAAFS